MIIATNVTDRSKLMKRVKWGGEGEKREKERETEEEEKKSTEGTRKWKKQFGRNAFSRRDRKKRRKKGSTDSMNRGSKLYLNAEQDHGEFLSRTFASRRVAFTVR